ncbi:hypothetical protein C1645_820966 [Glomus cerebriforme]|uniref:F-box domain-containing protein n=1 Tax=Glomus cerebriforme TaxID=658196 RepID=A0A397T1C6_9GLOM|nr:hypothetical protein C1645_820966 [Glomus cerebriforme]
MLNRDVFYLILEELKDDKKTLYSCLLVNKTWCEIIIPILWKNPWKNLKERNKQLLLDVIISNQSNQKRLFNYISFCRHLNLIEIIDATIDGIINLFINENTNFTHLYLPYQFDYQIHLIPGAKQSFSNIEFLSCDTSISDNVLTGLIEMCKSIKELELFINVKNNNYGIIKLIETTKRLFNVRFITRPYSKIDESFCKLLENSLIKHENTIQYFKITKQPTTKFLSSFINLKKLELAGDFFNILEWNCLKVLSLPFLQILIARSIPIKALTSVIESTNGFLFEIKIDSVQHDEINNKRIIQAIYQNCPNLNYLTLLFRNSNILELEQLLINCQYLSELTILINCVDDVFDDDKLFEILTKSSPPSLFKFKFSNFRPTKLKLKSFFDNWKVRHPMSLQFTEFRSMKNIVDLIEKYKSKGIVKKCEEWHF